MSKKSLKNISRKNINIVVTVLIGIALIVAMYLPAKALFSRVSETAPIDLFVQMEDTKSVTSELIRPSYGNTLDSLNVLIGTNNRVNTGELLVELIEDDTVVESWRFGTEDIPDYHYYPLKSNTRLMFEDGSRYFIRVTNFYNGENNVAIGMAYGNGPVSSDINTCDGQTICAMYSSYNSSLVTRAYVAFSVLTILIIAALCFTTKFLELPTHKIVIVMLVSIILVCIVQFDIIQGAKDSIVVKGDSDTSLRTTIEPGQKQDFVFSDSYDSFDLMAFHVYGDNKSEYLVSLTNTTTGTTYFVNSEVSILQRRQVAEGPGMILNVDTSLCPDSLFEEGEYLLTIQNTSPDTNLDIGIMEEGSDTTNPVAAVSLVRNTFLGSYISVAYIFVMVAYGVVIYYLIDKNKLNSVSFFLATVIPLSLISLVLFQTANVPDADAHFASSYHLSNAFLGIRGDREWMARSCDNAYYTSSSWWLPVPYPELRSISYAIHHLFDSVGSKELIATFPDYTKMKAYSLFNWLPQALGLTIGRLLGLNSIMTVYLGRLFILAVYIYTCYRAIKNTPAGKFIFCSIALLPANIMFATSFSYDCMFLIVSLNFIAIILKLRANSSRDSFIEALIWGFLLGSIKGGGALVLLPLVFLLFKKDKKTIISIASILLISGFAVLLFGKILAPEELFQFGVAGDGNLTASFALSNPVEYLRMAMRSYIVSGHSYTEQILGADLSWVEPVVPGVIVFAIAGITLIGAWSGNDELVLNKKDKVIIAIPVIISLLSTPMMLLSYTKIGSYMVLGIQGRYYSSILPLVFILIAGYFSGLTNKKSDIELKVYKVYAPLMAVTVYYMMRLYLLR